MKIQTPEQVLFNLHIQQCYFRDQLAETIAFSITQNSSAAAAHSRQAE